MSDAFSEWLRRQPAAWFVLVILAASYAVVVPFAVLQSVVPSLQPGIGPLSIQRLGLFGRLVVGSIVAPLTETALFQWAPIRLLHGKLKLAWPIVLVLSASLFAAAHAYSLGYVLSAFLVGLVFGYGFAVREEPKYRPFLLTSLIHALRNGIAAVLI